MDTRWRSIREDGSEYPGSEHPAMISLKTGKKIENAIMGVFNPHYEEIRWIRINSIPQFLHGEKNPYQVYSTFEDITEQRKAEENINLFFNVTLDMLCIANFEGYFIRISPSWSETLGWTEDELLAKPYVEFIHPDDIETTLEIVKEIEKGKNVFDFENRYRCKDDSYRWFSWKTYMVADRGIVIGAARDITEKKKAEEELKRSEENFRKAVENSPLAMASAIGGKIDITNKMFTEKFGYTIQDLPTIDDWFDTVYPDPDYRHEVISDWNDRVKKASQGDGKIFPNEVTIQCKDGTKKEVEITATLMGGRVLASFYDITKRKEEEEALRYAKEAAETANRAKSEFLANMSHEIRTPLNAVIGFSELLTVMVEDEKQSNYLGSIKTAGRSLLTLINDILDLSKIEADMMEIHPGPVNLNIMFREIEQIFSAKIAEKGLFFNLKINEELPSALIIDEIRLRQVLLNLVGNAIKFTKEGYVALIVEKNIIKDDKSTFDIIISVEDTGIGIPEKDYDLIFDAFRQQADHDTKVFGGTGLGLSISKKLVEMMNGEITVMSKVDTGSNFIVVLKNVAVASVEPSVEKGVPFDYSGIAFHEARALVVDDVSSNRILVKELLTKSNLNVLEAENGQEALLVANEFMPDIIIMDLRMPIMDGFEALKNIRENPKLKEITVIALTASADRTDLEMLHERGFNGYLTKPVNISDLYKEISQYIPYTKIDKTRESLLNIREEINSLNYKEISNLSQLIHDLKSEVKPAIDALKGVIKMGTIKEVSNSIILLGENHNVHLLVGYGKELFKFADRYDIGKIKKALNNFYPILEKIISLENDDE